MDKSVKKLVKVCVIGGILYGVADIAFSWGKGVMLGDMFKYGIDANEIPDLLLKDADELSLLRYARARFVKLVALRKIME